MTTDGWQQTLEQEPSLRILQDQWSKQLVSAQPLTGGLTNQCWKISTQCGNDYVWRPHSQSTEYFSLHRSDEYQVLQSLQNAPFSPKVELLIPEGLLIEWIDGECLNSVADSSLNLVMRALSDLHQYPVTSLLNAENIRTFDYKECIHAYWQRLTYLQQSTTQKKRFDYFYAHADELYQETLSVTPLCLCHFDLGDYNIIQTTSRHLMVIDWEYAAFSSPIIDLATTILAGQFDVKQGVHLYAQYYNIEECQWFEIVQQWIPYLRFMAMLWHQISFTLHSRQSDQDAIKILNNQLELDGY
ncbi:phosphotransferase [Vibrio sp. S17_S38]|uniref:phosphotransferase n=1 Tax=Vibrio sp. S17_S38 TaxID=2720229 RepID=UPI0016804FCE|nr:phosphotransferase [Vibrio sp. S17_S38]MBD1573884.1 phosphotransferase [Vibrio sp. S17_S38]